MPALSLGLSQTHGCSCIGLTSPCPRMLPLPYSPISAKSTTPLWRLSMPHCPCGSPFPHAMPVGSSPPRPSPISPASTQVLLRLRAFLYAQGPRRHGSQSAWPMRPQEDNEDAAADPRFSCVGTASICRQAVTITSVPLFITKNITCASLDIWQGEREAPGCTVLDRHLDLEAQDR
jgi:hypothetical protein